MLVCRLAWNHPLPDGNKRAAWVSLAMFLALNGWVFEPDPPDVDEAEPRMLAIAAHDVEEGSGAQLARRPFGARTQRARRMILIPAEV